MVSAPLQLDLFGDELAAESTRHVDALTCLRDSHPRALEILTGERRPDTGEVRCGLSGSWAYSVRRAGFCFEDASTWGGWYSRPAHVLTWPELDELVGADPRLADVAAWSRSLAADARRDRYRPFELWPDPESWHPSYIKGDRDHPGWADRLAAWRLVLAILDDAIGSESSEPGDNPYAHSAPIFYRRRSEA